MSISFYVKNKKKFFTYEPVLTVQQALKLSNQELEIYNFDFDDENFDKEAFFLAP